MKEDVRQNVQQVAQTLEQCLKEYFREVTPKEQAIAVEMEEGGFGPYEEGRGVTSEVHFHRPDGGHTRSHLTVDTAGGNVYKITVQMAERPAETFTMSIPDANMPAEGVQPFTGELCQHLLDELKRVTGEEALRDATAKAEDPGQ